MQHKSADDTRWYGCGCGGTTGTTSAAVAGCQRLSATLLCQPCTARISRVLGNLPRLLTNGELKSLQCMPDRAESRMSCQPYMYSSTACPAAR
jgi:hypothetical protein